MLCVGLCVWPVAPYVAAGSAPSATAPDSMVVSAGSVLTKAFQYLHYPYAYTGNDPSTGFSCIGYVSYVYQQLGLNMPDELNAAMASFPRVPETGLLPGDIIFFQNTWWPGVSHVAIYIGGGQIIHAENPQRGVNITSIANDPVEGNYWTHHYLVAERPWNGAPVAGVVPIPTPMPTTVPSIVSPTGLWVSVTVPSLNARSEPSLSATVVTVLTKGTRLAVLQEKNGWIEVQLPSGDLAWVILGGVTKPSKGSGTGTSSSGTGHPSATPTLTPSIPSAKPTRTVVVRVASLRVHNAASLTAPVIAVLTQGQRVGVLAKDPPGAHGWMKVAVSSTLSGWLVSRYVSPVKSTKPPTPKPKAAPVGHLTIRAHLRAGPSLSTRIIQWVPAGATVTLLHAASDWDHVRIPSGTTGYIWAAYVAR